MKALLAAICLLFVVGCATKPKVCTVPAGNDRDAKVKAITLNMENIKVLPERK